MKSINVYKAKTHLSSVLSKVVEEGQTYLICRNGKPVADLIPHRRKNRLIPHPSMSKIKMDYDPVEPLARDEWMEED